LEFIDMKAVHLEKARLLLKDARSLPISCLFAAPTTGSLRSSGATTGNSQLSGEKEDKLESATGSKETQDAADYLWFGC
jgi:hypothetical protein